MLRRTATSLTVLALTGWSTVAGASLINADFETGDLTGWNLFTFDAPERTGSTGDTGVVAFDTNGNGDASNAARFQVGQTTPGMIGGGSPRIGGGIWQSFNAGGLFEVMIDIAASSTGNNADGGIFELLIDGIVQDTFDFGDIAAGTIERGGLSASLQLAAGLHELRIRIGRGYGTTTSTPFQYVDNVVSNLPAATPVPVPGTLLLMLAGLFGMRAASVTRRH